jgi:hypothetical protein
MLKIVIPCNGNKSQNLDRLLNSIKNQSRFNDCQVYFAEDDINPSFKSKLKSLESPFNFIENDIREKLYGLRNVCRVLDNLKSDCIIGIIDCDDFLWGNDCFDNIFKEYENGFDCVWTANSMINTGINFSSSLDHSRDVYEQPWVSSHLKTFKLKDYQNVPKSNFLNESGNWFDSCYDQALMLPILHSVLERKGATKYIDKVHYIYNNTDPSKESRYRTSQLNNEKFIRSRGFLKS